MNSAPTPCACTSVKRASRVLARTYDASLASSGMNVTQLAVMRAILRHPGEPLTRVAEDLAMDRTSLYRMLTFMQRKKWIELEGGVDGRSRSASIPDEGKAVLKRADLRWANTQIEIINRFGQASWQAFDAELGRLIECAKAVAAATLAAEDES